MEINWKRLARNASDALFTWLVTMAIRGRNPLNRQAAMTLILQDYMMIREWNSIIEKVIDDMGIDVIPMEVVTLEEFIGSQIASKMSLN